MRTRNQILIDIVEKLGGTITKPLSRNQLLKDWLSAI